jgi:two-component system OmpR family response regulator
MALVLRLNISYRTKKIKTMGTIRRLNKRNVFIVDDSPLYREIISNELKGISNIDISTYDSAENCIKNMDRDPALIILDFYLDGENSENMNGHFAMQQFRKLKKCPQILFVSSLQNQELLMEYSQYRDVDFILKSELGTSRTTRKIEEKLSETYVTHFQ